MFGTPNLKHSQLCLVVKDFSSPKEFLSSQASKWKGAQEDKGTQNEKSASAAEPAEKEYQYLL